jgi:hypothetical protein
LHGHLLPAIAGPTILLPCVFLFSSSAYPTNLDAANAAVRFAEHVTSDLHIEVGCDTVCFFCYDMLLFLHVSSILLTGCPCIVFTAAQSFSSILSCVGDMMQTAATQTLTLARRNRLISTGFWFMSAGVCFSLCLLLFFCSQVWHPADCRSRKQAVCWAGQATNLAKRRCAREFTRGFVSKPEEA